MLMSRSKDKLDRVAEEISKFVMLRFCVMHV